MKDLLRFICYLAIVVAGAIALAASGIIPAEGRTIDGILLTGEPIKWPLVACSLAAVAVLAWTTKPSGGRNPWRTACVLLLLFPMLMGAQGIRTAFVPWSPVLIVRDNGVATIPTDAAAGTVFTTATGRYAMLRKARDSAPANSMIFVGPGSYTRSAGNCNLIKDDINWYFEPGAVVTATTTTVGSIFDDSEFSDINGAVQCTVGGYGTFIRSGCNDATDTFNVILITNPASVVHIHGLQCLDQNAAGPSGTYGIGNSGIRHAGGTAYFRFDIVSSINGVAYWWDTGDSYINAEKITGHSAIYVTPNGGGYVVDATYDGTSQAWITAQDLIGTCANTEAGGSAVIVAAGPPEARAWVTAHNLIQESTLSGCVHQTGMKLYLREIGKFGVPDACTTATVWLEELEPTETPELWLSGQKLTAGVQGIRLSKGRSMIRLQEIEDPHNDATAAVHITGGTEHTLDISEIDAGTHDPSGVVNGGYGVLVDTTANTTAVRLIDSVITTRGVNASGINVASGDSITMEDVRLYGTSTKSLEGAGTATVYGSFDFTVNPIVTTLTRRGIIYPIQLKMLGTVSTGDGKDYFVVPPWLAGRRIISVRMVVAAAGTTGNMDVQFERVRAGSAANIFTDSAGSKPRIETGEFSNATGLAGVIDTANDDLTDGDLVRMNIDTIQTTPATNLTATLITD